MTGFAPMGRLKAVLVLAALALGATPAVGQLPTVIVGRVEDAVSRSPLAGARVQAADSTDAVFTNAAGEFSVSFDTGTELAVFVEQYGYEGMRFELPPDAPTRITVLLLQPSPIELPGLEVVQEAAIDRLLGDLEERRAAHPGSVLSFNRAELERFGLVGSVWDFIDRRVPELYECNSPSGLCTRGRTVTIMNPNPSAGVSVCIDAWDSYAAIRELSSIELRSIASVEIYDRGRSGIRVYTPGYLASSAHRGRNVALPLSFGC